MDWVAIFLKSYERTASLSAWDPCHGCRANVSTMAAGDELPEVQRLRQRERDRLRSSLADARRHRRRSTRLPRRRRRRCLRSSSRVEARRDLPTPSYVLHTSPNHMHLFWRVTGFDQRRRRTAAEAARTRAGDGSRSNPGHTEHPVAGLLQSQARPAASRDRSIPGRRRSLWTGRLSAVKETDHLVINPFGPREP